MLVLNIDEICGSMVLIKKLTHTHGDGGGDGPNGSFSGVSKRAKYPRRPIFWVVFWQTMGVMLQIAAAFGFLAQVLSHPFLDQSFPMDLGDLKLSQALRRPWVAVVILSAGALCRISEIKGSESFAVNTHRCIYIII